MNERNSKCGQLHNVPKNILDAFISLVKNNPCKQCESSLLILKYTSSELGNSKNSGDRNFEVKYIYERLVTGLGSSRESARQGFFTTLVQLLQLHPDLLYPIVDTISNKFNKKTSFSKDEARNQLVGELMAYGAMVRSGCIYRDNKVCSGAIQRLVDIRRTKQYADTIATQFLCDLIQKDKSGHASNEVLNLLRSQLSTSVDQSTLSLLWLRLTLMDKTHLLQDSPSWLQDTLSHYNYAHLVNIFMQSLDSPDKPIHPLIPAVILALVGTVGKHDKKNKSRPIIQFWKTGVNPSLKDQSPAKQIIFLSIAKMIIPHIKSKEEVKIVLSAEFISIVKNCCHKVDANIKSMAVEICTALTVLVQDDKEKNVGIQFEVLSQLLHNPGSLRFDKLTGTRTIQQCHEHLTPMTIKCLAEILGKCITDDVTPDGAKLMKSYKTFACQWLAKLVVHVKMSNNESMSWRCDQVVVLMTAAYFSNEHPHDLNGIREAFSKSLDQSSKHQTEHPTFLGKVIELADTKVKSSGLWESNLVIQESWINIVQQLKCIKKQQEKCTKSKLPQKAFDVFNVLYAHLAFLLFSDASGAKEIIDELDGCYKNFTAKPKKKNSKTEDDEPVWVDVIVDLLLSLLTKGNHTWRSVVQGIFRNLCSHLTSSSITAVTDVLLPEKVADVIDSGNQNNANDGDENSDKCTEVSGDEDSSDDDSSDNDDKDSDEEDDDDDDDDDDEGEEIDANVFEMRKKMLNLVGIPDDLTDVDMDSVPTEELEQLDKKLGALMGVYLQKKKKSRNKKKLAKDETQLLHFRTRVCDLVEVLINEAHSMSHIIQLIQPLIISLQAANRNKLQEPLQNRLISLLQKLSHVKKFGSSKGVSESDLIKAMDALYKSTAKSSETLSHLVGGCCCFLMHCGVTILGDSVHTSEHKLILAYKVQLQQFFTRKDIQLGLKAYTLPVSINYGSMWNIGPMLTEYGFDMNTRLFRRTQALEVLKILFSNQPVMKRIDDSEKKTLVLTIVSQSTMLMDSLKDSSCVKNQYLCNLLDLLRIIKQNTTENKDPQWFSLGESLKEFRRNVPLREIKTVKQNLNKLFKVMKLPLVDNTQEDKSSKIKKKVNDETKSDDVSVTPEKNKKKKKVKTPSVQQQVDEKNIKKKRKKEWQEAKKRRLGSQVIDELEDFSFANNIEIESTDCADIDSPEKENKKKHKSKKIESQ